MKHVGRVYYHVLSSVVASDEAVPDSRAMTPLVVLHVAEIVEDVDVLAKLIVQLVYVHMNDVLV